MFATAALTSRKAHRVFPVKVIIVYKVSQMPKIEAVDITARFLTLSGLEKVIILGDPKQLPTCVLEKLPEFYQMI